MAKFTLRYNVTVSHDFVVEADSLEETKELAKYTITDSDVLDDFDDIDEVLYDGAVSCDTIFDENGDAHYL